MGKVIYPLFLSFVIQFLMIIYLEQEIEGNALYNFLINPTAWTAEPFYGTILGVLITLGGSAIIAGLYFIRNEWIVYASMGAVLISFGASYYMLWQYLASLANFGDSASIMATIITSPMLLIFVFAILDFTRGKD